MRTAIFIPVVDRFNNIVKIIPNIRATTQKPFSIYVITDNKRIIEHCRREKVRVFSNQAKTYIERINWLYKHTNEPLFFTGTDDIKFSPGWLDEAKKINKPVVGVNNTITPIPTHFLIKRSYIREKSGCLDFKGVVFCPLYRHFFCDIELIATAKQRGDYGYAEKAAVKHLVGDNSLAKPYILQDQGTWQKRKIGLKLRI